MQTEEVNLRPRVHPDLKECYDKMSPFFTPVKELVEETRKAFDSIAQVILMGRSKFDHVPVTTKMIPGPKDAPEVSVRIYNTQTDNTGAQRPALLFIHGGGYIIAHPHHFDNLCKRLAQEADCIVVSPDYRRAPESPYPAAIEDCYATLVWMRDTAQELGLNPKKIAVAGQSCGGGLCASLSLLARDRDGPEICLQMPLYPMVDNRSITASNDEIATGRVWCKQDNVFGWKMYLGDLAGEDIPQYAVPMRATDFSRLPPTFTFVGELDALRDETMEYVLKLSQAKVPVEFHLYAGCFHGFDLFFPDTDISEVANLAIINALKKAFQA